MPLRWRRCGHERNAEDDEQERQPERAWSLPNATGARVLKYVAVARADLGKNAPTILMGRRIPARPMRGIVSALLALLLAWAPAASGDSALMVSGSGLDDVYVCVDPAKPDVSLSSTDCASGTPDTATVTFYDSTTGTEVIVHLKACLEGGCRLSVCVNGGCETLCATSTLCVDAHCRWGPCERRDCPMGIFCWYSPYAG